MAGGGRSSARETIGRVAAGAIAKKLLKVVGGTEVRRPLLTSWDDRGRVRCGTVAAAPQENLQPFLGPAGLPAVAEGVCTPEPLRALLPRPMLRCAAQVLAYVNRVRDVEAHIDHASMTLEQIESNPVRCPDPEAADLMYKGEPAAAVAAGAAQACGWVWTMC